MFKIHYGNCVSCCQYKIIVVKKGFCKQCNHNHKQEKKSPVKKLKGSEKKKVFSSLKRKMRKPTGELALFKKIWEERIHFSQLSYEPILEFDVFCFSHILSKKAFPKFRLKPENIILITREEHIAQHNGNLPQEYKEIIAIEAQWLKEEYYQKP